MSPFVFFTSVYVIAVGVKSDLINLALVGKRLFLMLFAALIFPREGHPMFAAFSRAKAGPGNKMTVAPSAPDLSIAENDVDQSTATEVLQQMVDINVAAAEFEPKPQFYYEGWSRLDFVVGRAQSPSSWIRGLPEMPQDVDWSKTIWGRMAPKSGWLLFFVAPDD